MLLKQTVNADKVLLTAFNLWPEYKRILPSFLHYGQELANPKITARRAKTNVGKPRL